MKYGRCDTCGVFLLQRGGFAATDLCGPCCTGEADTLRSITKNCIECKGMFETDEFSKDERCHHCSRKRQLASR